MWLGWKTSNGPAASAGRFIPAAPRALPKAPAFYFASVQLGPTFLSRAFQDHPLFRLGLAAFSPLPGGLPCVKSSRKAIENPASPGQ